MEEIKYDVFISYSRKDYIDDNNIVIPDNPISIIKSRLSEEGISYWFDEEGIYSGQNFVEKIVTNIEASKLFLFLSTANANESKWTCKEIASADEFGKPIIPVRIDKSPYNNKVMFRISDLNYIEYYTNPKIALDDLITSIKEHLQSIQEEENRKKDEEAKKREAELKRKEEEKAKKEQEEKRRREEQQKIVSDIELSCTKLNNEEKKIELDRSTLLVSTEKVTDEQRKNELKSYIISSSPIRKKQQEELKQLQTKLIDLEAQLKNMTDEKTAEKMASERECDQLRNEIDELKTQLEGQPTHPCPKKNKKLVHIIYGTIILFLIILSSIWLYALYDYTDYLSNDLQEYYQKLSDTKSELSDTKSELSDAEHTIDQLANGNPFIIMDICVYNIEDNCGDSIISEESTYLIPKIYTYCTINAYYTLDIKFFFPSGSLATGSISSNGYSYSHEISISHGNDWNTVSGWGSETPGYWRAGTYRIEVWYKGKMLKSKYFTIY